MKHVLLTAVATTALLAACTPEGSENEVARVEVDQGSADSALSAMGLSASGVNHITFDTADFNDGVYTFTNVVMRDPDEGENDASEDLPDGKTLGDGEDDGPDEIRAARMIIDNPHLDEAGNVLMNAFLMEDISVHDDEDDATVTLARFGIDQPNAALSADIARVLMGDTDGLEDDSEWNNYAFGAFELVEFLASGTDDEDGGEFQLGFDRLAFLDLTEDALGRMEFLGLSVTGEEDGSPINISLAEVSIDGLRTTAYSSMMDAIASGADEEEVSAAYYNSAFTDPMEMFDSFAVRDFLLDAGGINMTLDHMTGSMEEDGDLVRSTAEIGSFLLWPDASQEAGAQLAMGLGMLGYERIELTMASESVFDREEGRAYTVGENYLEITDGLRLEMTQDFGGYNEYFAAAAEIAPQFSNTDDPEAGLDALTAMMSPLIVNNFSVKLEDLSLLDRAINAGALAQGVPPEQLRAQAGMMVAMGAMAAPPEVPATLMAELSAAVTEFITNGGSLTIDMSPPEPITLGEIIEQSEAGALDFERLGLTVNAEAPVE